MSIIFCGTPHISNIILKWLIENKYDISGVITQKEKDKKYFNEVKDTAIKNSIKLFQPEKMNDIYDEIVKIKPTLIITCAFGKIFQKKFLEIPKLGCINIHMSLLPKYRGANPIAYAIMNGDKITGSTLMYMDAGMDTGNIISSKQINIDDNDTTFSLSEKLAYTSCELLNEKLPLLLNNKFNDSIKQNNNEATYTKKFTKEDEKIDWNKSALEIDRKIRSLYNNPMAYTEYKNLNIKIISTKIIDFVDNHKCKPGTIVEISKKNNIVVCTSNGFISLNIIQLPSKKITNVKDILNGNHIFEVNTIFN